MLSIAFSEEEVEEVTRKVTRRDTGEKKQNQIKRVVLYVRASPVSYFFLSNSNMRNIKGTNEGKPITMHGETTWT